MTQLYTGGAYTEAVYYRYDYTSLRGMFINTDDLSQVQLMIGGINLLSSDIIADLGVLVVNRVMSSDQITTYWDTIA